MFASTTRDYLRSVWAVCVPETHADDRGVQLRKQRIAHCPVSLNLMMVMNVSEWMRLKVTGSRTVKKPKSWRHDLEPEEMTVVASSHIHHSSHPLAHSHDNHQRIGALSTTSTARQRQTKCLLGDTHNLARLTPDTAKSTHQPASTSLPFSRHQVSSSPEHVFKGPHITARTLSSLESHFGRRADWAATHPCTLTTVPVRFSYPLGTLVLRRSIQPSCLTHFTHLAGHAGSETCPISQASITRDALGQQMACMSRWTRPHMRIRASLSAATATDSMLSTTSCSPLERGLRAAAAAYLEGASSEARSTC